MWCVLICVEADVMEINLQVVGVKYKHRNTAWGSIHVLVCYLCIHSVYNSIFNRVQMTVGLCILGGS